MHLYQATYKLILNISFVLLLFCCKPISSKKATTELDGFKVPDGFTIERIVDPKLISYPMFASFDGTGRLFIFESDGSTPSTEEMLKHPVYRIRLLEDTDNDGIFDKSTMFADSLTYPKGGVFYKGSLYVSSSPDFLRLTDTDSNGTADKKEKLITGWRLDHNGALLGGPFMGPDGWMYLTDARRSFDITTKEGQHLTGKGARIWRCKPDGSKLEWIVGGGYDNAIELIFMPSGETVGTMTYFIDPQGGQRDALMHWVEGGIYPKPLNVIEEDKLKLTGELMPVMTKTARVAPSGLMRYRGNAFGNDFHGDLFSAEFNTGRIIRHKISQDGATFKTVDEPFITATKEDIHPTDVLQDADGSIILVNTGGWFIAGCPLSREAKLNIPGGIYRIRKSNAQIFEDPWGKKIDMNHTSADQLVKYVLDKRHVVSDNATEHLVDLNNNSIAAIKNILLSADNEEIRAKGVFILGRIGTENAMKLARLALNDSSHVVKTAAIRVAGLAKDKLSTDKLKQLVQEADLAVRRQAAISIEQIGDSTAVEALLRAAAGQNDRVAEHAIIHALIMLKSPGPLLAALNNSSAGVRKSAIIALDQMDDYKISKHLVVPFLQSEDEQLEKTGVWVALHHADWSDIVIDYLTKKINGAALNTVMDDQPQLYNLMIAFSNSANVQHFVGNRLANTASNDEERKLMLDVMANAKIKRIPAVWISQIKNILAGGDARLKLQVLGVIQSRSIKELNAQVQRIILNEDAPAEFRLKAMNARLTSDPLLTAREFDVLTRFLDSKNQAPVRQLAVRVLAGAELSSAQLIRIAKQIIPASDAYTLPGIVGVFEGSMNSDVGFALVTALSKSSSKLDNMSEEELERVFKQFASPVRKSADTVINIVKQKNAQRFSQLQALESSLKKGDIGSGRKLFFGKAICSTCHAITNEGSTFAPDLTNIGEIRSRHDILEAIIFPSASFAREHETSKIITASNTYTGIIKEQYPDAIVLATGPGSTVRIRRSEITSIETGTSSLMPPGLDKQLTQQELSDLVAFLVSLPDGASGTIGY
jgi:putative membrane-bound dehydrogenase-like protein